MKDNYLIGGVIMLLIIVFISRQTDNGKMEKISINGPNSISVMFNDGALDHLSREEFTKETGIELEGAFFDIPYESDSKFYAGQVLYPDYVHTDTLVVLDGVRLSWAMSNPNIASDEDISDVLGEFTIPIQDVRYDTGYYHCIIRQQNTGTLNYNE